MDLAQQNLERAYELFIKQEQILPFCNGLSEYIDYILATIPYKEVFERHIAEYEAGHKKIEKLESQTLAEMAEVKNRLASIVKKRKLDIKTFTRIQTFPFNNSTNMFEEFESFFGGHSVGNGFRSDSLQNYLFDIAANLLVLGYRKDIQKFLVSEEEYVAHYARINGTKVWAVRGNENGNFIFSPTWPDRWECVAQFERERNLKPWGSFVELSQFKRAYDVVTQNGNMWALLEDDGTEHNRLKTSDRIDVVNIAQDLGAIVDDESRLLIYRISNPRSPGPNGRYLKIDELKIDAQVVHNNLLQKAVLQFSEKDHENRISTSSHKPILSNVGKQGYLKFYKEAPRIPIGKLDTRKYRLIQVLIEPLGVAKSIETVFEAIRNQKDDFDSRLKDSYLATTRKREIIDYTMKELQKIKGLKGKISLIYHRGNTAVLLNLA